MPNATVWELSALREHDIGTHMVKTLLSAVAVLVLMIGAQSAFAIPENQSGYNHGCNDAGKDVKNRYINSLIHVKLRSLRYYQPLLKRLECDRRIVLSVSV
jgi:hypothetical protein